MYSPDPSWQKVLKYFNGDARKTAIWFGTGNPMLGDISPLEMIQLGRREKLDKFIDRQLAANGPPTTEGVDVEFIIQGLQHPHDGTTNGIRMMQEGIRRGLQYSGLIKAPNTGMICTQCGLSMPCKCAPTAKVIKGAKHE